MNDHRQCENVSSQIVQVARAHRSRAAELLGKLGLHPGQEMILFQLQQQDGQTLSQLAERLGVQPPTVTKMVTRMEASGHLERRSSPRDNRITQVFLTRQARNALSEVDRVWAQLESETIAGLSLEERLLLRRLLMQVADNLGGETRRLTEIELANH
jgi:DNA-binding MarR family transcriptional regulator